MKHIIFYKNPNNKYNIAVLIKETAFNNNDLLINYIQPLIDKGITKDSILSLSLKYNDQGKCPAKLIKEHLKTILQATNKLGITTLLVADSAYFKTLTKEKKAEPHYGYIKKCAIKGYEYLNIILSVNYQALFYNPIIQEKLDMSINTLVNHINGTHLDLGQNIIHSSYYPNTIKQIQQILEKIENYPVLTCDIEAFSLDFTKAGIGTIAFAWNKNNGVSFCVDYESCEPYEFTYWCTKDKKNKIAIGYGKQINNIGVKTLLVQFFNRYKGKLVYHNGTYDIKVIIYELYMSSYLDSVGLINGLNKMYQDIEDTKLITYLATNTTAGNKLGLKHNAFEFTGNYAQNDIKDIRLIKKDDLLEYNLIDCLATWYVYNKNYPIMVKDQQKNIYLSIFKPSMKVITHMELVGMPMDFKAIGKAKVKLQTLLDKQYSYLKSNLLIKDFEWIEQKKAMIMANFLLKRKVKSISEFKDRLNPASPKQLQSLLYDYFGFEVIDKTNTGLPATGKDTLKKLLNNLIIKHNITKEELLQCH